MAPNIIKQIERLEGYGIEFNFQIVLCKGVNDKKELDKTIADLGEFLPLAKSLSVVPVGLTKHRDKLHPLEAFTKDDASEIIAQVNTWQKHFKNKYDTNFVYLADEFYLKASEPLPTYEEYEEFYQLENGVGMVRNFLHEFEAAFKKPALLKQYKEVSVVTGTLAHSFMQELVDNIQAKHQIKIYLYPIVNKVFGQDVTVCGLVCAKDIISSLKGKPLGDTIFIPKAMLKSDEDIFLDDITVDEMAKTLGTKVVAVDTCGASFLKELTKG